jgi:hypothetical protein
MKKLEETELKKPYLLVVNLMEAHAPYTRPEGRAELSYLVPRIYNAVICTGQAPHRPSKYGHKPTHNTHDTPPKPPSKSPRS